MFLLKVAQFVPSVYMRITLVNVSELIFDHFQQLDEDKFKYFLICRQHIHCDSCIIQIKVYSLAFLTYYISITYLIVDLLYMCYQNDHYYINYDPQNQYSIDRQLT